jgi:hypothetical protein
VQVQYSETAANGGGFGLGFSVVKSAVEIGTNPIFTLEKSY